MSDDLILQARLKLLRANLTRATSVPTMLEGQRQDLARLRMILSGVRSPVGQTPSLTRHLRKLGLDLEPLAEHSDTSEARGRLDLALACLGELTARLEEAAQIAERLHGRRVAAAEDLSSVLSDLQEDTRDFIAKVEELLGPDGQNATIEPTIWREYAELLEQTGPRFDECVELLQGLSAREHGLEDTAAALFDLADTMIRALRLSDFNSDSFTIPSRREVDPRGRMHVLRVRFSEWTEWTLPLVAFEFGRMAAQRSQRIQAFLGKQRAGDGVSGEVLIADGLATFALGPAYACAAIVLRLQPPHADNAADHDRVRMILSTLRRLNKDSAFDDVIDKLSDAWDSASRGANPAELPGVRTDAEMDAAVEFLYRQAGGNPLLVYPLDEFYKARNLANAWVKEKRSSSGHPPGLGDLRDARSLMNMAWLCRLEIPSESDSIAELVLKLWSELRTSLRGTASTSGQGLKMAASQRNGGT